jgi:glycosyltransferase involved in cell wall biosynthesis
VANSNFVRSRVERYYRRQASVVHPPIEDRFFQYPLVPAAARKPYFLCFGAMVPYKRIDLTIEAANRLNIELVVAGAGPEESRLRKLASRHVRFVINPDDRLVVQLLSEAKALIFPGVEDFGMIPVEAMALGTPLIAYGLGGALDSVTSATGLLFDEPTVESLAGSIAQFHKASFSPDDLRQSARQFSRTEFLARMRDEIGQLMGA